MLRFRIRGVWILISFQLFFIVALYCMQLNSQQSSLQQARVNVNIISLQSLENSDTRKSLPQDSATQEIHSRLSNISTDRSTSVISKTTRTPSTTVYTDTAGTTLWTFRLTHTRTFKTFLLIMLPILPSSFSSREMIHSTWYKGFTDSEDVMLRFAMGIKGVYANLTEQLVAR